MNWGLFFLYLIETIAFAIPFVLFIVFRNKNKDTKLLTKITAGLVIFFLCNCFFHIDALKAMMSWDGARGQLNTSIGCVNLVGVPYGTNRIGNFFAWLGNTLFYPGLFTIVVTVFIPFNTGKRINRYIQLPVSIIEFITLFNLVSSLIGSTAFNFESIFIALAMGLGLSLSLIMRLSFTEDSKVNNYKECLNMVGFFLIGVIAFMPAETMSVLFSTDGILFGRVQSELRVYDLNEMHRMFIYLGLGGLLILYFLFRNTELNVRKAMILVVSVGALRVLLEQFNAEQMFPIVDGHLSVNVTSLPIHLCNTAMFVIPICLAFNSKRLFYFAYFINVFGALCALLMPNIGETLNCFSPNITIFYYNHFGAFGFPLLCVALKLYERPKFKQMLWSLLFFAIYYVLIVFLNAWLSNYCAGGTDYLFINNDFILSKVFSDVEAERILNNTLSWQWGELTFVIRPLYQSMFFGGYVAIAFGMWFVYSLFFRIADSHYELMCLNKVARKENIKMKDRKKLAELTNDGKEICLHFDHFSKRYGKSPVLSADNVELKVEGGQIFGFLGPNGAGKSTCIKSAIGIQPITDGNIYACGYDVGTEPVEAKKQIGYVPDHYALYEKLTGREYINYIADLYGVSKKDRNERITRYLQLFELSHAFDNRMQTYSHGMKQKIAIMAALVHNPKIWILDEPLTGLDPQSIFQVKECMKQHAAQGNIVFFSSHIIEVVEKLCTRIAILKKGKIVYQADMKTLEKEHPEGLEAFYLDTIHQGEEKE